MPFIGNQRTRILFLLLVPLLVSPLRAQVSDTSRRAPGATVSGVVRDSISRTMLAKAVIQLAAADSPSRFAATATSDSLGRFAINDVPDGRYLIGFFHAMLDSLGVELLPREVVVAGHRPVLADLAIPSPRSVRSAICGERTARDTGALVIGVVRSARDGTPMANVEVIGEWLELSFTADGFTRDAPRRVATTAANGWFGMCNVPNGGTMRITATQGADSTDQIELIVPGEGFLRQDLMLGAAKSVLVSDSTHNADSVASTPTVMRSGEGRHSGTVVTAEGGRPLAGALVRIANGPVARANSQGEWTISDAPLGTRMLEVRAVGYYPENRPVHVRTVGGTPIRSALPTMKAVLDTVRIAASQMREMNSNGFEERRRRGLGEYVSAEEVARRQPIMTSDLFRLMTGVQTQRLKDGNLLYVRSAVGSGWCTPSVYIDGHFMFNMNADEIDNWVNPDDIAGIEVYAGTRTPMEFQTGFSRCGSVVIWTKVKSNPESKSLKKRLLIGFGIAVVALTAGAALQHE